MSELTDELAVVDTDSVGVAPKSDTDLVSTLSLVFRRFATCFSIVVLKQLNIDRIFVLILITTVL